MKPALVHTSPQRVDPLSWYTRPLVPLSFAVVAFLFGLGSIIGAWPTVGKPWLDLVAVVVVAGACLYVQSRSRVLARPLGIPDAVVALILATIGLALSTWANLGSSMEIQYWWAPVGVAVVIVALTPYSSMARVSAYSAAMLVVTAVASLVAFWRPGSTWPIVSTVIIGSVSIVVAFAAATTFIAIIVGRTLTLLAERDARGDDAAERRDAIANVERHTIARLGARVSPFLERIADSGVVTDEDRAMAGQLARRLRSDLIEHTGQNWLESLSEEGRIFVVDPERRADRFNSAQRTALRGLVNTVLASPGAGSLFLELRPRGDDSTAVALSFDLDLPDGHRSTLIAPFYLALQSTVTDLRWDRGRGVVIFEVA